MLLKRDIPLEQATTELTEQSLRQIDSAWAKRIADNPQTAAFLRQVAQSAGSMDVGGSGLFDARVHPRTPTTRSTRCVGADIDLYKRITNRNASGIVPGVRGAYVAYADAGTDPHLARKTPERVQQLLDTERELMQQGQRHSDDAHAWHAFGNGGGERERRRPAQGFCAGE